MLPQSKLQDVFFTAFMAFVMVYAMICYNISLNVGGMQNFIFFAGPLVRNVFGLVIKRIKQK